MNFQELAEKRYSCRKFSNRTVEKELLDRIVAAAQKAPTAVNRQPFQIFRMESEEAKANICKVTKHTFGANAFFVIGYKQQDAWIREFDGRNFAAVDGAIVATHMMLETADLGLATTWVGHFDAPKLKEIYPEMQDYELIALFPVGYAAEDAEPSPRHFERKTVEEIQTIL